MQRRLVSRWVGIPLLALLALAPAGAAAQGAASSGSAAGPAAPGHVTATGIALVPGVATASSGPRTLDVGVQVHIQAGDVQSGTKQAQQKIDAVKAALEKAGVDPSAIHVQNFNVGPRYGAPLRYMSRGASAGPVQTVSPPQPALKQVTGFTVNENLQVTVSGLDQLAAAMSAAIAAGATSVDTFRACCNVNDSTPQASAMATAIGQATAQAEAEARAAAQAAGVALGGLRSLTVAPPMQQGPFGPDSTPNWRVQVTVSYDVAS